MQERPLYLFDKNFCRTSPELAGCVTLILIALTSCVFFTLASAATALPPPPPQPSPAPHHQQDSTTTISTTTTFTTSVNRDYATPDYFDEDLFRVLDAERPDYRFEKSSLLLRLIFGAYWPTIILFCRPISQFFI
jgi:hypothetical protein